MPGQRKKKSLVVFLQREICLRTQEGWYTNDTSSSESESLDHLNDDSDFVDEDEADQEIIEGYFVVEKVRGKSSMRHYIARVDALDGDKFEEVFLRQVLSLNDFDFEATFVINECKISCHQ